MSMYYNKAFRITDSIKKTCEKISMECNDLDQIRHSFFVDSDAEDSKTPLVYYAEKDQQVVGFLSTYVIDSYNVEFCLFVLPQYQRNQIGSTLFAQLVQDYPNCSFIVSLNPENNKGKAFLSHMGFEHTTTECSMRLSQSDYVPIAQTIQVNPRKDGGQIIVTGIVEDTVVGQCIISTFDSTASIHDVEIYEEFRGKGYGYLLLMTTLNSIFPRYDCAILHVTKNNYPAYHLYCKAGFSLVEELDYYQL